MDDLISRQAAIDEIDEWIKAFLENGHKESAADACLIQDGIIQLPSAQPKTQLSTEDATFDTTFDCISRQAAIDAIEPTIKSMLQGNSFKAINVMDKIRNLPSAQPEIIRCKDCKHWGEKGLCCKWDQYIGNGDFYCGCAERRTDG